MAWHQDRVSGAWLGMPQAEGQVKSAQDRKGRNQARHGSDICTTTLQPGTGSGCRPLYRGGLDTRGPGSQERAPCNKALSHGLSFSASSSRAAQGGQGQGLDGIGLTVRLDGV